MRICLIYPPITSPVDYPAVCWPLGLAYIAAVLEKEHEVFVIDAPAEGWKNLHNDRVRYRRGLEIDEIIAKVKKINPDVVGITSMFMMNASNAIKVAQAVKSIKKDLTIITGGADATIRPFDYLKQGVDFVVVGEGEHTIVELIHLLEQGNRDELPNVKGIAYLKLENGRLTITPPRPFIEDLDSLPIPARHLLPVDAYFEAAKKGVAPYIRITKPWATIMTTRGCPYNCVFCAVQSISGRKFRTRSPQNVVQEMEYLIDRYGVKYVDFMDDNMTLDKRRWEQILDIMIEGRLNIEWSALNVRADSLDDNILTKMKRAGCWWINLSPESGSQRVVDSVIKKNQNLQKVEEAVTICRRIGIKVGCNFVLGLINETKEDLQKTVEFARKLKRMGSSPIQPYMATPYYGTELYEQAKRGGFLLREADEESMFTRQDPFIGTPDFTIEELKRCYQQISKLNPFLTREILSLSFLAVLIRNPRLALFLLRRAPARLIERIQMLMARG